MFNTRIKDFNNENNNGNVHPCLVHPVEHSVSRVELDGGQDSLPGGSSRGSSNSSRGHSSISSRGNGSIRCWGNNSSRELSGPLSSAGLSSVGSVESSLGLSNLGSSGVDGSNRSNSIVDGSNGKVVTDNTETEVISNIVDSVYSGLVHVSVRSLHTTVGVTTLLLGRVHVLVSVGKVTELVLGLELAAGGSSHGSSSNYRSSSYNRGSSS